MSDKTVERFTQAVERVFSADLEKLAKRDFEKYQHALKDAYDAAIRIVIAVKDAKVLAALMKSYLTLYERYASKPDNIHYYRSDQLFEILVEQSGKVKDETLFETWDGYFLPSAGIVSFRNRYNDLSPTSKSKIDAFRQAERVKRRQTRSVLDVLRDEYLRQVKIPPKSNAELYDFNPRPGISPSSLDYEVGRVMKAWKIQGGEFTKDNAEALNKAIDAFVEFLKKQGRGDLLTLFQIIRVLRLRMADKVEYAVKGDDVESRRTKGDPHERVLQYALYGVACIELLSIAQATRLYTRNRLGFTAEETEFFGRPVEQDDFQYRSNIHNVLAAPFKGPGIAVGQIKAFLGAYVLTANQLHGCDLVPLGRTLEIQQKWRLANEMTDLIALATRHKDAERLNAIFADPDNAAALAVLTELSTTRVVAKNPQVLGQKLLTAGTRVGSHSKYGDIAVVYIEPNDHNYYYVEFSTLRPQIFHVDQYWIDNRVYGEAIMEMYRSTVGVVEFTQLIFAAMGFMPVLIEAGFAGLIYELALNYVSGKVEEMASEIDPTFGKVLGFLIQTFAKRPDFSPKLRVEMLERADNSLLNDALHTSAIERPTFDRGTNPINRAVDNSLASKPPLPGPVEHFPFAGGKPLPQPESPNKVYRIMSNDEAAQTLKAQKLPPPIKGAEGERFVSLDSEYAMLFREKELEKIEERFGNKVDSTNLSIKNLDDRIAELERAEKPDAQAISELNARKQKVLAADRERGVVHKDIADRVIGDWHAAEGQQVVVEIELESGALDDMLGRSVDWTDWGEYSTSGKDVFMWKFERGYGRNIGIPKWQLENFNGRIKNIRMSAYKQPLGKVKMGLGNN